MKLTIILNIVLSILLLTMFIICAKTNVKISTATLTDNQKNLNNVTVVNVDNTYYIPLHVFSFFDNEVIYNSSTNIVSVKKNPLLRIGIYPSSTLNESYIINVYDNATIETLCGIRRDSNISSSDFFESVVNSKTSRMSYINLEELLTIAKRFEDNYEVSDYSANVEDGYIVGIIYNSKEYKQILSNELMSDELNELVEFIISLSPLDVNIRGWA